MLISCKCLNFIASNSSQRPLNSNSAAVAPTDAVTPSNSSDLQSIVEDSIQAKSSPNDALIASLTRAFLQKCPRNFIFYTQCMEFFQQVIGPITDLAINAINQRDLIYSLTLDVPQGSSIQAWQISICINCNSVLCAKRMQYTTPQFFVNSLLMTSNDELIQRRNNKSYSDTFGILIVDHPRLTTMQNGAASTIPNSPLPPTSFTVGSLSSGSVNLSVDSRQQRLRQLQQHMQQRLKCEIAETNERIQRYNEQQFALLKSFREKAEQEYEMLARLLHQVPERQASEWLDRVPPILEVNGGVVNFTGRRRNTIGSRRDLQTTSSTTTVINPPVINFLASTSAIESNTQDTGNALIATTSATNASNRKVSNFDTPPATPEAQPMSIGNSPTFRQQSVQFAGRLSNSQSFQQQFPTPTAELEDDCFFDLEGVDGANNDVAGYAPSGTVSFNLPNHQIIQTQHQQFQRSLSNHQGNMSDLDESDGAEEAEDALNLDDCSMPIPMHHDGNKRETTADVLNFAKSLPIAIANSPIGDRAYIGAPNGDDLENNVDIAASIKALAKSVHGEAVFGDLPRPRLRSQI